VPRREGARHDGVVAARAATGAARRRRRRSTLERRGSDDWASDEWRHTIGLLIGAAAVPCRRRWRPGGLSSGTASAHRWRRCSANAPSVALAA